MKKQKNDIIGIYKITNPKGKVYIGKSINVNKRIDSYKYSSRIEKQHKIRNSINKYGLSNHKFELIEECKESDLDKREIYWINKFNSVEGGLNITYGGQGGRLSEETKLKKSKSMTGKKASAETRKKISESRCKGIWGYPVLQFDKQNNFIKEWNSATNAAEGLNLNRGNLYNTLNGRKHFNTCGGYIWKYKKDIINS